MPNGARHVGQADAEDGVDQAELAHGAVVLDDQHLRHDHELQQDQREGDVAAGELEARERVAGERAQDELRARTMVTSITVFRRWRGKARSPKPSRNWRA